MNAVHPDKASAPSDGAPRVCIVGTAGHIDHGKSALVKALTGTDPDRLPEEQARGLTIELGFAHLRLAGRQGDVDIGIVDVPGHEKFVRTMVAGATGIDIGLLVVAADDGVMPQTLEHVDILDHLGVESGLVVISKSDSVDQDRINAVESAAAEARRGTTLEDWRTVAGSARTGAGIENLKEAIADLANSLPARETAGVFRMAIDRVFAVHGRGTVVTGSILSGKVAPGDALELLPPQTACKVREIQSHGSSLQCALAGQRAALNLTGVDRSVIHRGMELATPGYLTPTRYLDARIRLASRPRNAAAASGASSAFTSHRWVRMCMGTRETMAVLVVIGGAVIAPGESAFVQLRCAEPIVAAYGQRFILRDETASFTLGGGQVVRPVSRRLRPNDPEERTRIERAASDDPCVRCEEAMRAAAFSTVSSLAMTARTGVPAGDIASFHAKLKSSGRLVDVGGGLQVHAATMDALKARAGAYLKRHHATSPQEPGIPRDRFIGWLEKRSAAGLGRSIFSQLEEQGAVVSRGPYVASAEFCPALAPEDEALIKRVIAEINAAKFDPPPWTQLKAVSPLSKQRAKVLEDIARTLPDLVSFAPGQYISREAIAEFRKTIEELGHRGSFKLAEVRDRLGLSRRVVQPLLEYLDRIQITRRVGDERVLIEKTS